MAEVKAQEPGLVFETENIVWIGETGFESYYDNLIVLMDEFNSGFECAKCKGADIRTEGGDMYTQKQVSYIVCDQCGGKGKRPKVGNADILVNCTDCGGRGSVPCPECGGTGTTGIAIPDQSKGAPTTGKIVSVGPDVTKELFKLGDRVMFSSYSGHQYDVTGKDKGGAEKKIGLRFLKQSDILSRVYGVLEYRAVRKAMALYTNS